MQYCHINLKSLFLKIILNPLQPDATCLPLTFKPETMQTLAFLKWVQNKCWTQKERLVPFDAFMHFFSHQTLKYFSLKHEKNSLLFFFLAFTVQTCFLRASQRLRVLWDHPLPALSQSNGLKDNYSHLGQNSSNFLQKLSPPPYFLLDLNWRCNRTTNNSNDSTLLSSA